VTLFESKTGPTFGAVLWGETYAALPAFLLNGNLFARSAWID